MGIRIQVRRGFLSIVFVRRVKTKYKKLGSNLKFFKKI